MTTPLSHLADPELVSLISDGNQGALAEAHRRHEGPIYGLANRLLRNPDLAEEVVQEVLLRLWRGPDKYTEERGTLRSYLLTHTHGRSVDLIRSESARRI